VQEQDEKWSAIVVSAKPNLFHVLYWHNDQEEGTLKKVYKQKSDTRLEAFIDTNKARNCIKVDLAKLHQLFPNDWWSLLWK